MEILFKSLTPVGDDTPDYAAGDCIGGVFTVTAFPGAGRGAKLQSITATDAANIGPAIRVLFFKDTPTGTYTDNAAVNLSAADIANLVGQVKILASDYETSDSYKIMSLSQMEMIMGASSGILHGTVVADAAYNGAATNDLALHLGFEVGM